MRADTACVPPIRYQVCAQDGTLQAVHLHTTRPRSKKKDMPWELPNGTKGLGGRSVKTLPLYRSETLRALPPGSMVVVCEGEKATDAAVAFEFDAVGTVTGSSGLPTDAVLRTLGGFHVVAWPDADVVGSKHMGRVLEACARLRGGVGAGLSLIYPGALGLTTKGDDAADWTPKGDAFDDLFSAIRPWTPPERPRDDHGTTHERPRDATGAPPDDETPPPEDDPEALGGHMIPEGKDAGRAAPVPRMDRDRRAVQRAVGPARDPGRLGWGGRTAELGDVGRSPGREAPRDGGRHLPLPGGERRAGPPTVRPRAVGRRDGCGLG